MAAADEAELGEVEAEWIRVFDTRHKRHYFFNATTGESQWIRPKGVPVAEAPDEMQERANRALGGGESAIASDDRAGTVPSDRDGHGSLAAAPAGGSSDSESPPSSPTPRKGVKKLRSLAKGVANILGLRKKHAGKTTTAQAAATDNPLSRGSPPSTAAAAAAGSGSTESAPAARSEDAAATGATGTASPTAAASSASSAEPPLPPPAKASTASASAAAAADSAEGEPESRLARTMSDNAIKPPLRRVRSILKRSSTMHVKTERRISFADQSGKSLANVVYCDNLHYSQAAPYGTAPPDPSHDDDDGNCVVM